jgi:hypothetical protein
MESSDTFVAERFWPPARGANLENDEQRPTVYVGAWTVNAKEEACARP